MIFFSHYPHILFNIIIRKITNMLMPFLVKYKMISLLSTLLELNLQTIKEIKPKNKIRYRVLVLSKSGGIDDLIRTPKNANKNILYLDCPRSFFKNLYFSILEVKNKKEMYQKQNKKFKKKYYDFLILLLKKLFKKNKYDAFIGFNFNYFAEKDLHATCTKLKIPFLLLYKEGVSTDIEKKYLKYSLEKSKSKFKGSKIAVYSNEQKKTFYKSNFFDQKKIEVVGCSRLNKSFHYKKQIPENQILYYAIQVDRGLPNRFIKEYGNRFFKDLAGHKQYDQKYNWSMLHSKTLNILKKFAINNPETKIIIKIKIGTSKNKKQYLNLPKNIKLQTYGLGHDLLAKSKVVIGWNTTAMLEAIAANRFILLPCFHKKKQRDIKLELSLKLKNQNYGYSENDFYKKLSIFVKKKYNTNQINNSLNSLNYYLGNKDNKAHIRLDRFIKKNIKMVL